MQGAIATGMLFMGLAVLIGGFVPSGAYDLLAVTLSKPAVSTAALAGVLLVLSALAFKSSLVPFHSWAPDAYESARPEVAAFLASGPKLGAIGAMALFAVVATTGPLSNRVVVVLSVIAGLSILVGSVGALRQTSYTRMLGYAGVAQAGYAAIGVVILSPTAAVFFASTYAIATTGTFLAATRLRTGSPRLGRVHRGPVRTRTSQPAARWLGDAPADVTGRHPSAARLLGQVPGLCRRRDHVRPRVPRDL